MTSFGTDGRTDGQTDGRTDGWTDGRSDCTPRPAFAFGDAGKNGFQFRNSRSGPGLTTNFIGTHFPSKHRSWIEETN